MSLSDSPRVQKIRRRGRGIYLLPNLFTTAALFAGFYGLIAAFGGRYEAGAIAILVAMVLDGLDGRIARMTNTTSAFGAEYDSMADMVSFGVAPAFLVYAWSLSSMSTVNYGRLARFNIQDGTADKRFFQGLACPSAAAVMALMVWVSIDVGVSGREIVFLSLFVTLSVGVLMVSNFMYYSFKDLGSKRRVPFIAVPLVVALFTFTSVDPPKFLLFGFSLYALSGPLYAIFRLVRKRRRMPHSTD